jgi:hypothetical protein
MNRTLLLASISTALLAACGGGGDDDSAPDGPAPIVLSNGLWGKVSATHLGVLRPGTYALSGCQDASGAPLQRKLRLGEDGRMELLDAANADAVLLSLVPSQAEHQSRSVSITRNSTAQTVNSYSISHQRVRPSGGNFYGGALNIFGRGDKLEQVSVQLDNSPGANFNDETCLVRTGSDRVATIEMVFSNAIAHEKLASLVALNGGTLNASPYSFFGANLNSVAIDAQGRISTQVAASDSVAPWGENWVNAFGPDAGMWYETWGATNPTNYESGTPANPNLQLQVQHSTLEVNYPGYGPIKQVFALRRNTDGSGAPVRFYFGSL